MKKDYSGKYSSVLNFIGVNGLTDKANEVFGINWESENDVEQIQELIGDGYLVGVAECKTKRDFRLDDYINVTVNKENNYYYEIHVTGKGSFSTVVISNIELDDSDVILLGYEQDKLEDDDCHHIDYINELSFDEWDMHFNFNK